jgi:hypothetical protein
VSGEIRSLSVSKIGTFLRCPLQAKFRYKDKIREKSVGVMAAGRVVHAILEAALKPVLAGKALPSDKDLDDMFQPRWDREIAEESAKEGHLGWTWDADDPEKAVRRESRALVWMARRDILPKIRPKMVERKFNYEMDSAAGKFMLYGVIDLLEEDGRLVDWKTVRKVSDNARTLDVQFPGYSIFVTEVTRQPVTPARKIFLIRGKKPTWCEQTYEIGEHHREWFRGVAAEVWRTIQADVYLPNTGGWWHQEKFCSSWGSCPSGGGMKSLHEAAVVQEELW